MEHQTYAFLARLLHGKKLPILYTRFVGKFVATLETRHLISTEWPDSIGILQHTFGSALLKTTCGPMFPIIVARFMDDLFLHNENLPELLKPWIPGHEFLQKVHRSILQWHAVVRSLSKLHVVDKSKKFTSGEQE